MDRRRPRRAQARPVLPKSHEKDAIATRREEAELALADHRPGDPQRAGQDPGALHQPDRRAGRRRGGRHRGCERHAEGDRGELADGAGACPRFEFKPKNPTNEATPGFDYGASGYDPKKCNVGFNEESGRIQIEIKGLVTPKSDEGQRVCREDLNEVIAAFVQDKRTIERGLFDENLMPEELTQVRMGKIIEDKYPELNEDDQEAVRQHAVAALNLTQKAKEIASGGARGEDEKSPNTAFVEGVRRFAMDVRELDIDLIDRINPFGEAYAILSKSMSEERLRQVEAVIAGKRVNLTIEEARELARRALKFKQERGRLPSITSPDAWEKRMAEGVAFLARMRAEAARV